MSAASKGATGRPWAEVGPGGDTVYRVSGGFMGQAYDSTQAGIMVRSINRDRAGLLAERDANGLLAIRNAQAATKAENERDRLAARVAELEEALEQLVGIVDSADDGFWTEREGVYAVKVTAYAPVGPAITAARAALAGGKGGAA